VENRCRNCKHYYYGKCKHPNLDANDTVTDIIVDHVELAFDGDIQSLLGEVVEQFCSYLSEDEKLEFIESICGCCSNYLTDPANMNLDEISFNPSDDFSCKYYE